MKTILDELEEIDEVLTEGDATPEQERRGIEIVELCNKAPDLLNELATLKRELAAERRYRKEAELAAKKLRRQHFAYKGLQAIYESLKAVLNRTPKPRLMSITVKSLA